MAMLTAGVAQPTAEVMDMAPAVDQWGLPMDKKERRALAAAEHAALVEKNYDAMLKFSAIACSYLKDLKKKSDDARSMRGFAFRQAKNRRRCENRPDIQVDPITKEVMRTYPDGHLESGLTQGWSCSAASTASAMVYQALFKEATQLVEWFGTGSGPEGKAVSAVLDDLTAYWFRIGGMYETARPMCNNTGRDGSFGFRIECVRNKKSGEPEPRISWLPIEDIFWTNPELPTPEEQEGIFYQYHKVPYWQVRKEAAVFDFMDPEDGTPPRLEMVEGKYLGVDKADFSSWVNSSSYSPASMNNSYQSISPRVDRLTGFPSIDLTDVDLRVPLQTWVMDGDLTWELCQIWGIDAGPETDDSPEGREALADYLGQTEHWVMTEGVPVGPWGGKDGAQPMLLAFHQDYYSNPGPSLQWAKWFNDGTEFQGASIVDRAGVIEDMADQIRNAQLRITYHNSHPPYGVDKRVAADRSLSKAMRFLVPGKLVETAPGMEPGKAIFPYFLQDDPASDARIFALKSSFDEIVGINGLQKTGQDQESQTGTATELTLKDTRSRSRIEDVVYGMAETIQKAARFMVTRMRDHLGVDGLAKLAHRICGLNAIHFERYIQTAGEDFLYEYDCRHPAILGEKAQFAAAALVEGNAAFPGAMDQNYGLLAFLKARGFPNPESVMAAGPEPIDDPEDEHAAMAEGKYVEPSPREDFMRHLGGHKALLAAIQAGPLPGVDEEDRAMFVEALMEHIDRTTELALAEAQKAAMSAPLDPSMGGGESGGSAGATKGPQMLPETPSEVGAPK